MLSHSPGGRTIFTYKYVIIYNTYEIYFCTDFAVTGALNEWQAGEASTFVACIIENCLVWEVLSQIYMRLTSGMHIHIYIYMYMCMCAGFLWTGLTCTLSEPMNLNVNQTILRYAILIRCTQCARCCMHAIKSLDLGD